MADHHGETLLGRVHDDVMVDEKKKAKKKNKKTKKKENHPANAAARAAAVTPRDVAGSSLYQRCAALAACDWNTRAAILFLSLRVPVGGDRTAAALATLSCSAVSVG